jgi:hypothetical protein
LSASQLSDDDDTKNFWMSVAKFVDHDQELMMRNNFFEVDDTLDHEFDHEVLELDELANNFG